MERSGRLIQEKYREYFFSTLAMSGSTMIATVVDRIMVGNLLGAKELSAISLTDPIIFAINVIFGLFIYGGNTLAMTYKGHRDRQNADKCFTIAILGGMAVSALMTVAGLALFAPLSKLLAAGSEELLQPVADYLFPTLFAGALVILVNGTTAFVRSDGKKQLALALPVVSNVVNLTMDYVFMGVLGFGIGSAGWATNIGMMVAALLLISYFRSKERSVFFTKLSLKDVRLVVDVLHVGLASALLNASLLLKTYIVNKAAVTAFDTVGAVIISVCMSANSLANIFYLGASQTMLPIGGALYGERDWPGIRHLLKIGALVTSSLCLAVAVVLVLLPRQFASLFGVDVGTIGGLYDFAFRLFCLCIPFVGLQNVARSYLQACGYKDAATVLMILDGTVCFIPFIQVLSASYPQLMWLSYTIAPVLSMTGVYLVMRVRLKKEGIVDPMLLPDPSKNERVLEFTVQNVVGQMEDASERVLEFCRENGVPDKTGNRMWLAVQELGSNIAQYAYEDKTGYADLLMKIADDGVLMRVRDNGVIFDPTSFIDDGGREVTGLEMLRSMKVHIEYNRVLGFNNTIVTAESHQMR